MSSVRVAVCSCNPSAGKAEAGGSLELSSLLGEFQASETPCLKKKTKVGKYEEQQSRLPSSLLIISTYVHLHTQGQTDTYMCVRAHTHSKDLMSQGPYTAGIT